MGEDKALKQVNSERKKLTFASDSFSHDEYSKIASSAELRELALVEQSFKAKLSDFWKADESDVELKHGFFGEPLEKNFDSKSGTLGGGYSWVAEIRLGRSKPLKLSAEYFLFYTELECTKEDHAFLYFDKVARFTTYPYFRALFANCASNANLSLAPLPSLKDRVD